MKVNWNNIKILSLILLITGLYAFSEARSEGKTIADVNIDFNENDAPYITHAMVNKLLIQNYGSLTNVAKENLDLNTIEKLITKNEMVKSAEVYLTVNGELKSKIAQRKPIGRIEGSEKFYMDEEGKMMPLSKNYSARVPIITGKINEKNLEDVFTILKYSATDDFLYKNIIGVHIAENDTYQLKFRLENFVVDLGKAKNLKGKFNNYKAFYIKANKDGSLPNFSKVSLEFANQVVCTKI
ncbi:cell division protein FtsQ/DivIB [Spongiimicrobium salis]|uniref:cell division protein FtsQ/DivIB n=1 Tax=Spongiimicrobium salis TaxID=1667022 RepID=UPI00374D6725